MDDKLNKISARLDEIESNLGNSEMLKIAVRQAVDGTEHTRKIDIIINMLIVVVIVSIIFGIGNILMLWGLAK